ncbi:MAG: flagellar basal-body rod protein FlgF [Desulfohalobiaceae bacterium]|nr:flagellar basal-body rod protein FlgF [Desulfohalobiaceae bacterium]
MSSGVYSALSGSVAKMQKLEVAVNNLANVSNIGFKASRVSFESLFSDVLQNSGGRGMNFTRTSARYTDFSQGDLKRTGQALDLAIQGQGFFKVAGEDGFQYTRRGNFTLDNEGNLVTATKGLQVIGEDGPVDLPHQEVLIDEKGRITAGGAQVGQINVYEVSDTEALRQKGNSLWELDKEGTDLPSADSGVVQGSLEQSNVNPLLLTTEVIETKRAYAAYLKTMKSFSEMAEKARQIGQLG